MSWGPLPQGQGANPLLKRLKAMDAEIWGHIYANSGTIAGDFDISGDLSVTGDIEMAGDFYSDDWDGTIPLSLPDSGASAGFALDGSAGDAQFEGDIYVGGDLTLDGGVIATEAAGNDRIEIWTDGSVGQFSFVDSLNAEQGVLGIDSGSVSYEGAIYLKELASAGKGMWAEDDYWLGFGLGSLWSESWRIESTGTGATQLYYYDTQMSSVSSREALIKFVRSNVVAGGADLQALFNHGSSALPSVSFDGYPAQGMYLHASGNIGFSIGSLSQFAPTSTRARHYMYGNDTNGISEIYFGKSGSAAVRRMWVDPAGDMVFYSSTPSTVLTLNATRVDVGSTFLQLPVKATTGDPSSPADGDMYVNTSDNKVRVYADSAWRDLATW